METAKYEGWTNFETYTIGSYIRLTETAYQRWLGKAIGLKKLYSCQAETKRAWKTIVRNELTALLKEQYGFKVGMIPVHTEPMLETAMKLVNWEEIADFIISRLK
jgi:hypothetical protein